MEKKMHVYPGGKRRFACGRWMGSVFLALLLTGCSGGDPRSALDAAAAGLEENIRSRKTSAVMQQLHGDFLAQQHYGPSEVRQRMQLLFMRYQNIGVLVLNRQCELDKSFYDRGNCSARVGITGAQGIIPERAEHYQVTSQWQLSGKEWKLLRLDWQ